ncbi:MAG: outer membrane protein assembly factor BamD [Rickettsiaceae bacterium]|nr:outer membrane protein assembly factor BamD [Rickettsiaceae bacterium]
MKLLLITFVTLITLSSCAHKKSDDLVIVDPNKLYAEGLALLEKKKYYDASLKFGDIYFQHPGGSLTSYAEIMEAYSLYKAKKYLDAVVVIDNFISLHPAHEDKSYVLYLKCLCYFDQISDIHHDQEITRKVAEVADALIAVDPNSKYALDAKVKSDIAQSQLAGKEIYIGQYYQKLLNPVASINRFNNVINDYKLTDYAPEAYYRLIESYISLGLINEAKNYQNELTSKYPDNKWTEHGKKLIRKY